MSIPSPHQPDVEDAIQFIVRYIGSGQWERDRHAKGDHGYDLYMPVLLQAFLIETGTQEPLAMNAMYSPAGRSISSTFYAAAWELCRRGILRPSVTHIGGQATAGSGGNGYSITPFGAEWLRQAGGADYVPLEPGRFGRMLAERGGRFGPGFIERSQEAVRAYNALAYLACCAMCGAASESILLSLAIAQRGDEPKVLAEYAGANGRSRVETRLLGRLPEPTRNEFRRYSDLLKYWRDSAAHGRAVRVTEAEAYTSLVLLLRFAIFAGDRWDELTEREQ